MMYGMLCVYLMKSSFFAVNIFKGKEGLFFSESASFKVSLVVKGFCQMSDIDYNDVFFSVVKYSFIREYFGIVVMYDFEFEQLDVKIFFLYGELEEEIYID